MVRTSIVHVNSQNRYNGSINNFDISFKHCHLIQENFKGKIIIEPIQCIISRSFYSVDRFNDTFQLSNDNGLTWQTINISHGNYNIKTFLEQLKTLLPNWTLGWSLEQNKYHMYPPTDDDATYVFRFNNYSAFLFGCDIGDEVQAPFISTNTVNMERSKAIMIHSDLPRVRSSAIDNLISTEMEESNVFLKIPIDTPPWANIIWRSNSKDVVSFQLSSNSVSSMRIWLTDEYNIPIELHNDWTLSFRVTYIDDNNNELINMLSDIQAYVKYLALDQMSQSTDKKLSGK